ncbi:MAG: metal-dependent transcriptional regulator [Anaerolineae bacterium]|nr:metal-dependent transcriptional regulator [Anaerolineae bacterium]
MAGESPSLTSADLSRTMRDYLAEIYRLADRADDPTSYIGTSALADLLDVSPPAVNRMVTRLRENGLLEHEPYQGIRLTDSGRQEALKQLRNHRIVEAFLVNVMGFAWHQVHEEAERMSQGLSDILVERMYHMAKEPAHCPHGEPIPLPDGTLPELNDELLSASAPNIDLEITRVRTRESDRLEYLAALGLTPGKHLQIIHLAPFNGPLQLKVGTEYRIIGHNLAELIKVKPAV